MRSGPQSRILPDGRLHLQEGPIDLILEAFGPKQEIELAYAAAKQRFQSILDELCSELPRLRAQARPDGTRPLGSIARRMTDAVMPYSAEHFITPMAAVAGSVAEEILITMKGAARLSKAYVNNGGDIALHLDAGRSFSLGIIAHPRMPDLLARARINAADQIGGIATSGRHGRSFSLGIADAVTVLAKTAATADAAATIIANAVDLGDHPAIQREPASFLDPQSDLGDRLVTVKVETLRQIEVDAALVQGVLKAEYLIRNGLICAALLHLAGETRIVGPKTHFIETKTDRRMLIDACG